MFGYRQRPCREPQQGVRDRYFPRSSRTPQICNPQQNQNNAQYHHQCGKRQKCRNDHTKRKGEYVKRFLSVFSFFSASHRITGFRISWYLVIVIILRKPKCVHALIDKCQKSCAGVDPNNRFIFRYFVADRKLIICRHDSVCQVIFCTLNVDPF